MNAYVLSVIGTVLISAVLTAIIPEGKTSKVIKGIARLACVLVIVTPIVQFFVKGADLDLDFSQGIFTESVIQEDESFIQYCSEARIACVENALEEELNEKYGIKTQVALSWEMVTDKYARLYSEEKIKITEIYIKCEEKQSEEVIKSMREYITKTYCSEVRIE